MRSRSRLKTQSRITRPPDFCTRQSLGCVSPVFLSHPSVGFYVRIPTLFKERLFVYLSRFCEVRYCITRHCGFLLGLGRAAGDPNATAMTINQVIRLLQRPVPTDEQATAAFARLEAIAEPIDWPSFSDPLARSCERACN